MCTHDTEFFRETNQVGPAERVRYTYDAMAGKAWVDRARCCILFKPWGAGLLPGCATHTRGGYVP